MNLGYHFDLIREALLLLSEAPVQPGTVATTPSADALAAVLLGNSYTDLFQEENVERLADDTFCRLVKPIIECLHYDLLVGQPLVERYTRQLLANGLDHAARCCGSGDPLSFLIGLGVLLHIVQDLYAHSNWAELEVGRFTETRDPTLFDILANGPQPLALARAANAGLRIWRCEGERGAARDHGFYSHGNKDGTVPVPRHDWMKKDFCGEPHFEWGYRAAFRASVQCLVMVRAHLRTLPGGAEFWAGLAHYKLPGDVGGEVRRAVSFEEGTVRWMTTYGGAWKRGVRWGKTDMVTDDLPNAEGLGVFEQVTALPILGPQWMTCALALAEGLFETVEWRPDSVRMRRFTRRSYFQALAEFGAGWAYEFSVEGQDLLGIPSFLADKLGLDFPSPLADWLKQHAFEWVSAEEALVPLAASRASAVTAALAALDCPLLQRYQQEISWVFVRSPFIRDLDTGAGWDNVNNEEWGGSSDYWLAATIDGRKYTEAEYVDCDRAFTNWIVLKPCLGRQPLRVSLAVYESDPSDHTDEHMDVTAAAYRNLEFSVDPKTGELGEVPAAVEQFAVPNGTALRTAGTGDLRAELTVVAGVMKQRRLLEIALRAQAAPETSPGNPVPQASGYPDSTPCLDNAMALVGGFGWRLRRPDFETGLTGRYNLFTFDPGSALRAGDLTRLRLAVGKVPRPAGLAHLVARHENEELARFFDPAAAGSRLKAASLVSGATGVEPWITAVESEARVSTLTVLCQAHPDMPSGDRQPVTLTLLGTGGTRIGEYRLLSPEFETFQPGCAEAFWLGAQRSGTFQALVYGGPVKGIERLRLSQAGDRNLRLAWLEVYANGRLIGRSPGELTLTKSQASWELALAYPKQVRFAGPPSVQCRGVQAMPGQGGRRGIAYRMEARILMAGFAEKPDLATFVTPGGPLASILVTAVGDRQATVTGEIFLHRQYNPTLEYDWLVEVRPKGGGAVEQLRAHLDLPRPRVEIIEQTFVGGEELLQRHGHPALGYRASYRIDVHHYGEAVASQFRVQHSLEPEYEGTSGLDDLRFFLPAKGEEGFVQARRFRLTVQATDPHEIWPDSPTRDIEVPGLAVEPSVRRFAKICGYFEGTAGFQRVATDDPRYAALAATRRELRAEYRFAEVQLTPCQVRDRSCFSPTVFGVTYRWEVPKEVRVYRRAESSTGTVPNAAIESGLAALDPRHPDLQAPVGWLGTSLVVDLDQPRVLVDLGHLGPVVGIVLRCEVRDAVGQVVNVSIPLSNFTGASEAQLRQLAAFKHYQSVLRRFAEHLKVRHDLAAGLRADVPLIPYDIDPVAGKRLTPTERREVERVSRIVAIYQQNGPAGVAVDARLQGELDRLLGGSIPGLSTV